MSSKKASLKLERDLMPERADLRPEKADLRLKRAREGQRGLISDL